MTRRITAHGLTASLVTARKSYYCIDRRQDPPCAVLILPGEQYVRTVMFPNHDVYSYVDPVTHRPLRRPIVHAMCVSCAGCYDDIGPLVRDA